METIKIIHKLLAIIILRIKIYLKYLQYRNCSNNDEIEHIDTQVIWIFLAADYGNIGDVAITFAQHSFLNKKYPNAKIIEIPISNTLKLIHQVKRKIKQEDIITIVGGGNMSDLYDDIDFYRQLVVKKFSNNTIISFPQSIFYSNNLVGKICLRFAKNTYQKHTKLTLMARDSFSYEFMTKHFKNNTILLLPDIVFTLDKFSGLQRKGALFCMRNDKEKKDTVSSTMKILSNIISKGLTYKIIDTQIKNEYITKLGALNAFERTIGQFQRAEIVVTDRLHGMIFAFITGTPAIIFDNATGKVYNSYEWIKSCGYIIKYNQNFNISHINIHDNFYKQHEYLLSKFNNL